VKKAGSRARAKQVISSDEEDAEEAEEEEEAEVTKGSSSRASSEAQAAADWDVSASKPRPGLTGVKGGPGGRAAKART